MHLKATRNESELKSFSSSLSVFLSITTGVSYKRLHEGLVNMRCELFVILLCPLDVFIKGQKIKINMAIFLASQGVLQVLPRAKNQFSSLHEIMKHETCMVAA